MCIEAEVPKVLEQTCDIQKEGTELVKNVPFLDCIRS